MTRLQEIAGTPRSHDVVGMPRFHDVLGTPGVSGALGTPRFQGGTGTPFQGVTAMPWVPEVPAVPSLHEREASAVGDLPGPVAGDPLVLVTGLRLRLQRLLQARGETAAEAGHVGTGKARRGGGGQRLPPRVEPDRGR